MVNLNGHEVGNDGYSQEDTCSHYARVLLYNTGVLKGIDHIVQIINGKLSVTIKP